MGTRRTGRVTRGAVGGLLLAGAVVTAGLVATVADAAPGTGAGRAAIAQDPPPVEPGMDMTSSGPMMPGESMTVNGWGFEPGSTVTLWMDGTAMTTAVADTLGNVAFTISVPMTSTAGAHTMAMSGTSLAGSAVNLTTGVTIGALAGQLAPATPAVADPHMTG